MRLPTEAEWEYSYRAGTATAFHGLTGYLNGTNDDALVGSIAWLGSNSNGQTRPVGGKQSNGFGVHDMSGNVWELTNDWYDSSYYATSPTVNPVGASSGANRSLRGGSYWSGFGGITNQQRASRRMSVGPNEPYADLGFRVARNP